MNVAIVGSRNFPGLHRVDKFVAGLPDDCVVVSGGARGVDSRAQAAATARGLTVIVHHADWETYGKRAGFMRNSKIVEGCDYLVAFWDEQSKGTQDSIQKARRAGIPISIIFPCCQ